jgi:hypothetical protein
MSDRARPPGYYKRRYRRNKELWCYQIIRLDHDDAKALRALAKRQRTSLAELIRTFIVWGLEEYEQQTDMKSSMRDGDD